MPRFWTVLASFLTLRTVSWAVWGDRILFEVGIEPALICRFFVGSFVEVSVWREMPTITPEAHNSCGKVPTEACLPEGAQQTTTLQ